MKPSNIAPQVIEEPGCRASGTPQGPRLLRSPKAQQDYLWEKTAQGVLNEWQGRTAQGRVAA
jgi:hypothetical protein